jgi:hypothetical protein
MSCSRPILAITKWIVASAALWIGWPSVGCRCADGGFKFFCDARRTELQLLQVTASSGKPGDCCQHRNPVERQMPEDEASNEGCTPIANSPFTTPVVAKAVGPHDQTGVFLSLPVTTMAVTSIQPANLAHANDTAPIVDVVTQLHRLQI